MAGAKGGKKGGFAAGGAAGAAGFKKVRIKIFGLFSDSKLIFFLIPREAKQGLVVQLQVPLRRCVN